jgi:hypothetical protein
MKTIDYLFEDPPIQNQKFALISIVGPNMPQKCNVWGLKIRGVAETIEKAKSMTQRLMKIDNNYDIYTVELGKFFPLEVDPLAVGEVEYENQQLNELIKSYLENREHANEQWLQRKNEMVKDAIREGQMQKELALKPEPAIAVLQRMKNIREQISHTHELLEQLNKNLEGAETKFGSFTDEERENAEKELIEQTQQEQQESKPETTMDNLREQLVEELNVSEASPDEVNNYINSHFGESPYNNM